MIASDLAQRIALSEGVIESRFRLFHISTERLLTLPLGLAIAASRALALKGFDPLLAPRLRSAQGVVGCDNVVGRAIEFRCALVGLFEELLVGLTQSCGRLAAGLRGNFTNKPATSTKRNRLPYMIVSSARIRVRIEVFAIRACLAEQFF
jgi:hypothetical protein